MGVDGFFLRLPDEVNRAYPKVDLTEKVPPIDITVGLTDFVRQYPAWLNEDGMPKSWALYQIAMQADLCRKAGRALDLFHVMNLANSADQEARRDWLDEHRRIAGRG